MGKENKFPNTIRIEYRLKEEQGLLGGEVSHIQYVNVADAKELCFALLNNPNLDWIDIKHIKHKEDFYDRKGF